MAKKYVPIRKRQKKKRRQPAEIDITSLLDILVILLVFLLRSYDASQVLIQVPEVIELPISNSMSINTEGVILQISENKIWVDSELVYDKENKENILFARNGMRVVPIYNALVEKKETFKSTARLTPETKPFSGIANLVVHKKIRYDYLRKILYTVAESGFKSYKFVVMSEEQL